MTTFDYDYDYDHDYSCVVLVVVAIVIVKSSQYIPTAYAQSFKSTSQNNNPGGMRNSTRISHLKLDSSFDKDIIQPPGASPVSTMSCVIIFAFSIKYR
jgi:hypothetical protein